MVHKGTPGTLLKCPEPYNALDHLERPLPRGQRLRWAGAPLPDPDAQREVPEPVRQGSRHSGAEQRREVLGTVAHPETVLSSER